MPQIETEKTIHQQIASVARLTFAEWRSSLTTKKSKFRENKKKKATKTWRYHFTQVYQISWSYMLYCSWDMVRDSCNYYFSFWLIISPFTPLTARKIKMKKKRKKTPGDIILLHKYTKNHYHMLYCFWDTVRDGCNCHC